MQHQVQIMEDKCVCQQGMNVALQVDCAAGGTARLLQECQSRCLIQVLLQAAHLGQQSLCLSILAGSACEVGKVALVGPASLWLQISTFWLKAFLAGLPLFGSATFDCLLLAFGLAAFRTGSPIWLLVECSKLLLDQPQRHRCICRVC